VPDVPSVGHLEDLLQPWPVEVLAELPWVADDEDLA